MRILLAVALISFGLVASVGAAISWRLEGPWLGLFLVAGASIAFVGGLYAAGRYGQTAASAEPSLAELARDGLLELTEFNALRAFGVEPYEDEGLHYFVELADRSVLYLQGQYLDEYEPDPDSDRATPRRFPCREFTVVRDRRTREVVELQCKGDVMAPETVLPALPAKYFMDVVYAAVGEIVPNRTYDTIRKELEEMDRG